MNMWAKTLRGTKKVCIVVKKASEPGMQKVKEYLSLVLLSLWFFATYLKKDRKQVKLHLSQGGNKSQIDIS